MKLQAFLTVVTLLVSGALGQGPYAPSGWRPSGPTLELPQRVPQTQTPQKQEYLPPVDPRNLARNPDQQYGPPEVDVSVQGLPTQEQVPIFQVSPVNGQQYVGPNFNTDIRNLDQNLKQSQFQAQQEVYRQFARQRQLDAQANNANPTNQQVPRQFALRTTASPAPTTPTTANPDAFRTTQVDSTTEALSLNEGEILENKAQTQQNKERVTVEVSKQRIQEYRPELFLGPLAQLKLQSQLVPIQLGQIRAPVYFQPAQGVSQKQVAVGYDPETHIAALPSVLAQQQLLQNQAQVAQSPQGFGQSPAFLVPNVQQQNPALISQNDQQLLSQYQPVNQYQLSSQNDQQLVSQYQPVNQYQPASQNDQQLLTQYQPINQYQPASQNDQQLVSQYQPVNQYQPASQNDQQVLTQYQPINQYQPSSQNDQQLLSQYQPVNQYQSTVKSQVQFPQIQAQPVAFQPQVNQIQPTYAQQPETEDQNQPQFVYQQTYQPQVYQQPFVSNQYEPQQQSFVTAAQLARPNDYYQQQILRQQQASQGQEGSLQSGLDVNQQGNDIGQAKDKETNDDDDDNNNDGTTVTAVATAFGSRTQPRVPSTYGAPGPVPRVQADPAITSESSQDEISGDGQTVAEATAVARGSKRKSAKLRNRRVRPLFTLDRSGHLVLAQDE